MSKAIWKYPLTASDYQEIEMPVGARVLTAALQHENLCLWALVDPEMPVGRALVRIAGTGHTLPDTTYADDYAGTYQLRGGALVFHVFARPPVVPEARAGAEGE